MPARLSQGDGCLVLKLGGTKDEFAAQLARAKAVAGRRYNGQNKSWEFPDSDDSLLKVIYTVEPDLTKDLERRVQAARQEQAESLLTALPDDAPIAVPWQARLAGKQRSAIDFGARQEHILLADDMGAGKTVESISMCYEYLIRASIQDNADGKGMHELPSDQAADEVLQAGEDEAGSEQPVQSLRPGVDAEALSQGTGDDSGSTGTPVQGLRDSAPVGVYGSGSRSRDEAVGVREPAGVAEDAGGRAVEVQDALPELPPAEALSRGPFLVIAPNSVLHHWKRELEKWVGLAPEQIQIIDGKDKKKRLVQLENPDAIWFIVNHEKLQERVGLVVPNAKGRGPLEKKEWLGIIADECHRFKNPDAQGTKALWQLAAPIQVAASGTPVLNNPGELYALLRWLRPEQYTSYWKFFHSYTEFYEGYKGKPTIIGVKNADALRFELADKMVRRTKRQIHPDIPKPFDPIVYEPPMGKDQQKVYDETEVDFWLELAKEAADPGVTDLSAGKLQDILDANLEEAPLETIKLMIPNAATRTVRLRQVATSPATLGGINASSKMDDILRVVGDSGDRPWAFFAYYQASVDLLTERLRDAGYTAECFHGSNSDQVRRAELSSRFQGGDFQIIVASIGTGGQGIEFFRAADCGFLEESWVPGINQQAFDRVDRKGQKQRPQRHIWRTPKTVDTGSIAPKLATKRLIVASILGDD